MIPAIGRTVTTGAEMEPVPRETSALLLTPPEGTTTTPADVDVLADARAVGAAAGPPTPGRAYVAGWNALHQMVRRSPLRRPARQPLADVGRYLEHLVETEGRTLATVRDDRRGPPPGRTTGTRRRGRW